MINTRIVVSNANRAPQLGDVTNAFAQVAVVGPEAARIVGTLLDQGVVAALPEHGCLRGTIANGSARKSMRPCALTRPSSVLPASQRELGQSFATCERGISGCRVYG